MLTAVVFGESQEIGLQYLAGTFCFQLKTTENYGKVNTHRPISSF